MLARDKGDDCMKDIDLLEIKANAERLETTLKNLGLYVQGVNDAMGQMDKTISDVLTPEALNRYKPAQ